MHRPVWLLSMDSDQFNAPPTTTASLTAYFRQNGRSWDDTNIELVHFAQGEEITGWLSQWKSGALAIAQAALAAGIQPIVGFSFYTWNAAEFLEAARAIKLSCPDLLIVAGGPHVQQAEDYLGVEAIDLVFLGEAEISFQEFMDSTDPSQWPAVDGLAWWDGQSVQKSTPRERCRDLGQFPSPLEVLELTDKQGQPLYESISYETSRGCPFKCAFCEWGTGAIGSKMYQWPMDRIQRDWEAIVKAGIKDIWLADSNFGALKQDLEKAQLIVDLKDRFGLPLSFATSWSKKHSRQVQEIALLLNRNQLLPHYQLALQTLTPEALRLSNRQNMSSNEYQPIAKRMSEQGVPIAAELIWGLPGDNLPDFERNLDQLLATFPNINIFGYTLLPGTEFYRRREEYKIEAIPVAGYGKAKGEYVVGCHSFDRKQGEEGYFLISAHILLVHGHIMPLTTRLLALRKDVPVSPLFREVLRAVIASLQGIGKFPELDPENRMSIYEQRDDIYLTALADPEGLYPVIEQALCRHLQAYGVDPAEAQRALELDRVLAPRYGEEHQLEVTLDQGAKALHDALHDMELPNYSVRRQTPDTLQIHHPGGLGEILQVADGGSWLRGVVSEWLGPVSGSHSEVQYVAIA